MLGIALEILLSYFILKYFNHNFVDALGLKPDRRKLMQLALGIMFPILFFCIFKFTLAWLVHNPYKMNPGYTMQDLIGAVAYVFRAVLYEELIFRGALLYLLIQKTGTNRAMLVSSAAFGIYHWFAWQAFGNPVQMLVIFLMTGSCGYIFALAFVRTRSMYLPFALHLGNNITQMILFSGDASIGDQMLLRTFTTDPVVPQAIISIPVLIIHYTGFQLLGWYLLMKVKPDLS